MILFFFFGLKILWEAYKNEENQEEEEEEVEKQISSLEIGILKKESGTLEITPETNNHHNEEFKENRQNEGYKIYLLIIPHKYPF